LPETAENPPHSESQVGDIGTAEIGLIELNGMIAAAIFGAPAEAAALAGV